MTHLNTLNHLGIIRASGLDAASFLHNQLTQDFLQLGQNQARLAAFCTPQGRMLASFVGFKRGEDILLICSLDVLEATLKRLSMFVLRAKVKLTDATSEFSLFGLAGDAIKSITKEDYPAWDKADFDDKNLIFLPPAASQPRALWCAPAGNPAPQGALTHEAWNALEVQSGVAMITASIAGQLVPQMLNYESVGGVNFKKGCYPGQEVVARSQFRGTLKRRTYLAHVDVPATVGQEVFHESDSEQACGVVVASAGFDLLIAVQVSSAAAGALSLGNAAGPKISLQGLPYELLSDI